MTDMKQYTKLAALLLAAFCTSRLAADVVETTNGSRIVGKVTAIHEGVVTVKTDYAGDISVKQALVASITTDNPVAVRTADGTRFIGIVAPSPSGGLRITGPTGSVDTTVAMVAESWAAGGEDPEVVALRRKWSYEAGVDINGRSGTQTQMGTELTYHAKLAGPDDTFKYFADYNHQETDHVVSADQLKAGADYTLDLTPLTSWYVRDEGGFDRVNDITFYDVAATGFGYDFIKRDDSEVLTGRAGLSYRYEQYSTPDTPALSSLGADFELEYNKKIGSAQLSDKLEFVPAFKDFGNFIVNHEFAYEIPITKSLWKLSIGVSNTYNSRPVDDVSAFETLYFTRLVLAWGQAPGP
jgi:hypothetical protein